MLAIYTNSGYYRESSHVIIVTEIFGDCVMMSENINFKVVGMAENECAFVDSLTIARVMELLDNLAD